MYYKLGKFLPHTDEFEFIFNDGQWIGIDLLNDYPNYIYYDKILFKNQTKYDKKCYDEDPYSDNGKLYLLLYSLFTNIMITMI